MSKNSEREEQYVTIYLPNKSTLTHHCNDDEMMEVNEDQVIIINKRDATRRVFRLKSDNVVAFEIKQSERTKGSAEWLKDLSL